MLRDSIDLVMIIVIENMQCLNNPEYEIEFVSIVDD